MISRTHVIASLLAMYPNPRYLEIGVNWGHTFLHVSAAKKVAVDPTFRFDTSAVASADVEFFEVTSDEYFASRSTVSDRFDVIFLDGLHTFEQTLRDLLSAVTRLAPGGVIVIDDVLPTSFDASLPDLKQIGELQQRAAEMAVSWPSDGSWMGDVFKLVFFIETFMQGFSFATIKENHGQTVLWQQRRPPGPIAERKLGEICQFDFRDTILRRDAFNVTPFEQILGHADQARKAAA